MNQTKNLIWIDPPQGYLYGFPTLYCDEQHGPMYQFLVARGYPEKDILFAMSYMRCWSATEEEIADYFAPEK